ncbi:MAG: hypothetical protein SFU99_15380, partial [Saprospiraceae bacterium]|nr:hypothetical protein [Saprospiraceae bacterium]
MTLRLVKIAKELNVGTSTIVDYLNSHGFEIEDKPSAKVTDEMHNILIKEFSKDRDIKEQADQLIIGNRPLTKKEFVSAPLVSKIEKPAIKEETAKQTDASTSPEVKKEEAPEERPRLLRSTLKILGKIDLNEKKGKPEEKPVVEEPKVEQKAPEKPQVEVQEEKTEPVEAHIPLEATPPKVEQEQQEKREEKAPEKLAAPKIEAQKDTKPPVQEKEAPAQNQSNGEEGSSEQAYFRAEAPELRGLKILGKIDTDKFKKPQKKKDSRDNRPENRDNKPRDNRPENRDNRPRDNRPENRDNRDNKDRERTKTDTPVVDKNKSIPSPGDDRNKNRQGPPPQNDNSEDARKKRKRKRKKITTASEGGGERKTGENRDNNNRGGGGDRRGGGNDRNRDSRGVPQRDDSKEVSQKQVEEQIKATMARLSGGGKKKRQKMRRDNRERLRERQEQLEQEGQTG